MRSSSDLRMELKAVSGRMKTRWRRVASTRSETVPPSLIAKWASTCSSRDCPRTWCKRAALLRGEVPMWRETRLPWSWTLRLAQRDAREP